MAFEIIYLAEKAEGIWAKQIRNIFLSDNKNVSMDWVIGERSLSPDSPNNLENN